MSDIQAQEEADVAAIEVQIGLLNTAATNIAAEIATLQETNPELDLTSLNQAVTDLTNATDTITVIVPPAVVTPPPVVPVASGPQAVTEGAHEVYGPGEGPKPE